MKRFLLFLLFAAPLCSFSQSNYIKGYVITESGDTLKGYINYTERLFNPTSFSFKPTLESKSQSFNVKNSSGYSISDQDTYQRFVVDISMNSLSLPDLSTGVDSASKRDTVFLRVLHRGKNITLFSYTDGLKRRLYLQGKEDKTPYELHKQVFLDKENARAIINSDKYKYQLLMLVRKFNVSSAAVEQKLNLISYSERDIRGIVNLINGEQAVKPKYAKTRFFAGVGINYNQTDVTGLSDFANSNTVSKDSYSPILKAGVDLFANPAIGKLIYRFELSLWSTKSDLFSPRMYDDGYSRNLSFTRYAASLTPQLIYNIYNSRQLKFFVDGGVGINVATSSNNKYYITDYYGQVMPLDGQVLNGLAFSIPFSAGIVLHKKIEISAGYTVPYSIASYTYYSIRSKMFRAGISYFFGK